MLYNMCYHNCIGAENMPPKVEMTKDKILKEALELVREQGIDVLTARNLAQRLNCSTQPIYSVCGGMEQLKNAVYTMAVEFTISYMKNYTDEKNSPALNLGIGFLHLARNEKQLFKTVYLSGYKMFDLTKEKFIGEDISTAYMLHSKRLRSIDKDKLRKIYYKLTIYVIGIGTMINTETIKIGMDEAIEMLKDMYEILLESEHITEKNREGEKS
jgi:AcrR family transcriptional regulator